MSCAPTVCTGFSDVIGSWKIMAISPPRISRRRSAGTVSRSSPRNNAVPVESEVCFFELEEVVDHLAAHVRRGIDGEPAGLLVQAEDREHRDALSAPGLADDAERLARLDGERDAVDGANDPVLGLEVRAQIAHVEQGRRVSAAARVRFLLDRRAHVSRIRGSM